MTFNFLNRFVLLSHVEKSFLWKSSLLLIKLPEGRGNRLLP
uniref:Uncharacterized protein n=1 Tax=Arundo donax TaxID=35708 RepID=A0A0A9HN18_ARUDO